MRNMHNWDEASNRKWQGDWAEKYEHWSLDFSSTPPREYKEDRGMRVYRNGLVELRSLGVRNPQQRADMMHRYGVWFESPRRAGLRFYTPEGQHVAKTSITGSILFFHKEHKVALAGNHADPIMLYSEHAFPTSSKEVHTRVVDQERVDRVLALHEESLKAAATEAVLSEFEDQQYSVMGAACDWVRAYKDGAKPRVFTEDSFRRRIGLAYHQGRLQKVLANHCMVTTKHKFLRYEEV